MDELKQTYRPISTALSPASSWSRPRPHWPRSAPRLDSESTAGGHGRILPTVIARERFRTSTFHGRLTSPPTPRIPSPTPTDTARAALRPDRRAHEGDVHHACNIPGISQ